MQLVAQLATIWRDLRSSKEPRPRKVERLRAILADPMNGLDEFEPLPLPLQPDVMVRGIVAAQADLFKSNQMPLLLHFVTVDGAAYQVRIIFLEGLKMSTAFR